MSDDEEMTDAEICEWCKGPVRMMCQRDTEVCCQECAKYAAKILFNDPGRAAKFRKGARLRGM